jgi:hypothetical protein
MNLLYKTLVGSAFVAAYLGTSSFASAQCTVAFSDGTALSNVYRQARDTFGNRTVMNSSGKLVFCDPQVYGNNPWSVCWDYRQRCGSFPTDGQPAYVNVWPWSDEHMHLNFVNNAYNVNPQVRCFCDPGDGLGLGFGLKSGTTCVTPSPPCPDWAHSARTVSQHVGSEVIYFYTEKGRDGTKHTFTVPSVTFGVGAAVHVWYVLAKDGSTWEWKSLAAGTASNPHVTYNLNIPEVTSVWMSSAALSGGGNNPDVINLEKYVVNPVR